jgi:peptidoglycan/xylan/chitin deacetylase (PgdA/CDA1 family)
LDLLDEYDVHATFFLSGKCAVERETIVRRIASAGHEICSHCYDHLHAWKVSPWRALADIKSGWQAIDAASGSDKGVYPFRPPYGKLNIVCLLYLWIRKVPIVYWTLDSGDTSGPAKEHRMAAALKKATDGAVLLMHDHDRTNDSQNRMILEWVRSLLVQVQEQGIPVLTVQQLLRS